MRQENELGPAEREVEEALSRLRLPATTLDRDRLMFEAGRRSAGRSLLVWRAMMLVFFVGIGLSWAIRPAPQPVERIVYVGNTNHQPLFVASSAGLSEAHYLWLQRKVLAEGLDALHDVRAGRSTEAPESLTLDELLGNSSRGT
jgi:cell division septal protein FtsQ